MPNLSLKELIDEQIETSRGMNLFSEDSLESFRFIDSIMESMDEFAETNDEELANLVEHAKKKTLDGFCRGNQHCTVDTELQRNIETIYIPLLDEIRIGKREGTDDSMENIARRHFLRHRNVLKQANPFAETLYSARCKTLTPVPCSEYRPSDKKSSRGDQRKPRFTGKEAGTLFDFFAEAQYLPSLQIDLLGIDMNDLIEPVLDIGCGKEARLVKFLRSQGIEAFGMDRFVEPSPFLMRTSWFEFDFQPGRWGVILSHLGFSNHFVHHHHRNDGDFLRYAQTYLKILASLKIGGCFHYSPGLEFIEQHLDRRQYVINRKRLDNGFDSVVIERNC